MKNIFLLISLLFSFSCFAQVPPYAPTAGLVAFWSFTGNANDVSGNGNNGTVNGAVITTDRYGGGSGAYNFPNTTVNCGQYYIQSTVNTTAINTSGQMSVSFWVEPLASGCLTNTVMEFNSCPGGNCPGEMVVSINPTTNELYLQNNLSVSTVIDTFSNILANNWYHIAYTDDGVLSKYYLNGILVNTKGTTADPSLLATTLAFGRTNVATHDAFNGNLDDIGIWSRPLTNCEVGALYTGNPSSSFAFNPLQDTTLICDSVLLDAGAGYSSYIWSSGENSQTIYAKSTGLEKVTVTNSTGCSASDSTYINVIKPTISQDDTTVCSGSTIALTANGAAGSSQTLISSFTLSALLANNYNVPTIIGGNYIMTVSGIWSVHFCTDNFNVADAAFYYARVPMAQLPAGNDLVQWNGVAVYPDGGTYNSSHIYNYTLPPATLTNQNFSFTDAGTYTDNCGGLTFQIYKVNTSSVTYTWSANPSATAGLNPADINMQSLSVKPTATTTYYVTVNDGVTSCEDSVLITVAAIDTSITASDPLNICSNGGAVHLHAGIDASYQWLLNGTPIPAATNKDYTATQTGAYSVIGFTAAGCSDTSRALTIGLYPQPVPGFSISPNTTQCLNGNNFSFTNMSTISSGTLSYKWDFGDGNTASTINAAHSYAVANPSYTVQLIDSSNNGCMDTTQQNVVVRSPDATPIVSPAGTFSFCASANQLLTSSAATGNQWYNNGTLIATAVAQTYTATAAGTYNVITTNTCPSDSSNDVVVNITPTPATPIISASGPLLICGSGSVTLSSSALTGNKWYDNASPIVGATNQTYTAVAGGDYHVVVTVNNCPSNASADSTVIVVALPNKPIITSTGSDSICQGGSVLLSSNETPGNQWYQNSSPITGATNDTYLASSAGSYTVGVSNVCAGDISDPTIVVINPSPEGIRYPSINVEKNTVFPLQARTFGDTYTWMPATGLSNDNISDPVTNNFTQTQDYVIEIKTNANCITYDSLLIKAYQVKGFLVPTAFSPNNDGLNDKLTITLINVQHLNYFMIFNQWGQMIFQTSNSSTGWDGNYQGVPQPISNYVWIAEGIDADGKTITDHGSVMIVR